MGYLFLGIALAAGITKAYCGKKTSGYTTEMKDAMMANLIRMVLCVLIGFVLIVMQRQVEFMVPDLKFFAVAALSGIASAIFVVTWLLCVKSGAYMMVEVFLMLGVFLPMIAGRIFFQEDIGINKWIGMAALVVATLIMCSYNQSQKGQFSVRSIVLLIVCGISSGLADFSQKLFVLKVEDLPVSVFNFYTYVFAGVVLAISLYIVNRKNSRGEEVEKKFMLRKILGYIVVMSICLYANSFFKTKAALHLDSASLYPLNQGSALILSTLMSTVVFHEKLTLKCIVGLVIAFLGLLLINIF